MALLDKLKLDQLIVYITLNDTLETQRLGIVLLDVAKRTIDLGVKVFEEI